MRREQGSGCITRAGRSWRIRYYVCGERVTENTHSDDRAIAERLLKQRLAEVGAGLYRAPGTATVADIAALVLADHRVRRLRDVKTLEWRYHAHLKPLLGEIKAAKLTARNVRAYIATRRTQGAKDGTINRELAILRRAYTLARREHPPLVGEIPYVPKLEE